MYDKGADPAYGPSQVYGQQGAGIPVVVAQPASAYPTYAYDPTRPPQQVHVQQQQVTPPNRPPPPGFWGSNICDWPRNLFPSCWCACCCLHGCWIVGQMAEKTGFSYFRTIAIAYVCMWIITIAITFTQLASIVVWLPFLFMLFVNIALRLHIVRTRQITECGSPADGCGNLSAEFCCGFWCMFCAISQQARLLYGYTEVSSNHLEVEMPPLLLCAHFNLLLFPLICILPFRPPVKVFAGDASVHRKDEYEAVQVV